MKSTCVIVNRRKIIERKKMFIKLSSVWPQCNLKFYYYYSTFTVQISWFGLHNIARDYTTSDKHCIYFYKYNVTVLTCTYSCMSYLVCIICNWSGWADFAALWILREWSAGDTSQNLFVSMSYLISWSLYVVFDRGKRDSDRVNVMFCCLLKISYFFSLVFSFLRFSLTLNENFNGKKGILLPILRDGT